MGRAKLLVVPTARRARVHRVSTLLRSLQVQVHIGLGSGVKVDGPQVAELLLTEGRATRVQREPLQAVVEVVLLLSVRRVMPAVDQVARPLLPLQRSQ